MRTLVVDGHNVIGTCPDGWWRDRPAAARRLLARLQCHAAALAAGGDAAAVVLVLDAVVPGLAEGDHRGVAVRYARRRGRDAADDRIVEDLAAMAGPVEVVTSDRGLAARVAGRGATVTGASALLDRLDRSGC